MGALLRVIELYGSIVHRYGTLWNVAEALWGVVERYGTIRYRTLRNVMGVLQSSCGTLRMENIDFARH